MQEIKNGIDRTHLIGTDVSGSIPLPKKYEKALAFVLHRNLVNFSHPQDKQFAPTFCVGLTCLRMGFTRTSVLRVMSHAFYFGI